MLRQALSPQQLRVCRLRVRGKDQAAIAKRLGICQQRVSQHLTLLLARYPKLEPLLKLRKRARILQLAA